MSFRDVCRFAAGALRGHLLDRTAVELAIVALAEPRIEVDGNRSLAEGELGGLDCPPEIGGIDDVRLGSSLTELSCLCASVR